MPQALKVPQPLKAANEQPLGGKRESMSDCFSENLPTLKGFLDLLCLRFNTTRVQLAEKLGFSRSFFNNIERLYSKVPNDFADRLIECCGLDPESNAALGGATLKKVVAVQQDKYDALWAYRSVLVSSEGYAGSKLMYFGVLFRSLASGQRDRLIDAVETEVRSLMEEKSDEKKSIDHAAA